jgi:hypothetical protein
MVLHEGLEWSGLDAAGQRRRAALRVLDLPGDLGERTLGLEPRRVTDGGFELLERMYTRRMPPVAYETETPHATPTELGPYREADFLELPGQPRCELRYGRLPVTPAPTVRHQLVVARILRTCPSVPTAGYRVSRPSGVSTRVSRSLLPGKG